MVSFKKYDPLKLNKTATILKYIFVDIRQYQINIYIECAIVVIVRIITLLFLSSFFFYKTKSRDSNIKKTFDYLPVLSDLIKIWIQNMHH